MPDLLVALGMLSVVALFAYAVIHTGRTQRQAKASVFQRFADENGLQYVKEDDGAAQEFARGFDGLGRFRSPSLGNVIPTDVVTGIVNGAGCILFRHSIRFGEGWAREWFVAGVRTGQTIAARCAVQFCKRRTDKDTMYLKDPVLNEKMVGPYALVVRAGTSSNAGRLVDSGVLDAPGRLAGQLPFRPELQVRENRIVAYPADRNTTIPDTEALSHLLEFTRQVAELRDGSRLRDEGGAPDAPGLS